MADDDQNAIDKINQLASEPTGGSAAPTSGVPGDPGADVAQLTNGAQGMMAEAKSGVLKFDQHTGQSLINMLNAPIDRRNEDDRSVEAITRQTKLGMTPGGQAMDKFNKEVAATGPHAFAPVHLQFKQTLMTMVQALQLAMENYAKAEDENKGKFKPKD